MKLTPLTYSATLENNGKVISATISKDNEIGIVKILASSFFTEDSSGISVMEIARFLKSLGTEYAKEFSDFHHFVLFFTDDVFCSFASQDLANLTTSEVLQLLANTLPFRFSMD